MVHRRLVYIYLLNVLSFSSRYFNKGKQTSRLGRLLALSLEILKFFRRNTKALDTFLQQSKNNVSQSRMIHILATYLIRYDFITIQTLIRFSVLWISIRAWQGFFLFTA